MNENDIQKSVFAHLKRRSMSGVLAWHVPNLPEARRKAGFLAGCHDVHVLHNGRFYTVELKTERGVASYEQLEFRDRVNAAGGFSVIAEGHERALWILEDWGILRREV